MASRRGGTDRQNRKTLILCCGLPHLNLFAENANNLITRLRYLHPAAHAVGVKVGGWHDFRHTLIRKMRKAGVHPVVVSGTVGHKRVELAPEVYDHATQSELRDALGLVGKQLLPNVLPSGLPN